MLELDERTRHDLDQLRRRQAPSAAAKQRMLAGLELRLGAGPDGDGLDGDPSGGSGDVALASSKAGLGYAAKVVGATVALTIAGLVTVRTAVVGVRAIARDPAADQSSPPEPAPESMQQPDSAIPEVDEKLAERAELDTDDAAPPLTIEARPGRPSPSTKHKPSEDADSLAAEMALLEAANAASNPTAALTELERHRDRFPEGQLADEREILRIEAMCGLRDFDAARAVAQRFLASRPSSPLRPRVRAACPALDPESK